MLASKEKTKNKSWPKELLDVESEEKAAEKDIVTDWEMREVGQYNRARSCTSAEDGASTPGDQVMEDYGYSGPQAIQTAAETVTEGMGKVSMGGASTI